MAEVAQLPASHCNVIKCHKKAPAETDVSTSRDGDLARWQGHAIRVPVQTNNTWGWQKGMANLASFA